MVIGIVLIAIFVVVAIVVIGVIVYLVGINNQLVALKNTIDRSFADIRGLEAAARRTAQARRYVQRLHAV
jgi:hypothetical protein